MADMTVDINFSTNAKIVKQQIATLNAQIQSTQASTASLQSQLSAGKATSRNLTGDIRARKTIEKLDRQINDLAEQRMKAATRGVSFGAQDAYVKGLIKSNEQLRIQKKIIRDNAEGWINLGKNTQWAGRQLVVGFTVPLTIAAGAAMKAFSDLEKELVKFKRVYGDVNTTVAETQQAADGVKALSNEWVKFGVAVSDTIGLAAEAAGAGFQGQQLLSQVEQANKLAVLGQLEQQKAMQATIALQSTFKMSNEDLAKSINFLNQLENQTMVTMEDMTTAIPKAATVIQGLGGDVEDLGIMMAALREGGVSAAEGANALKSGLGSLLNPSKEAAETLNSIGVNLPKLWEASEKNGEGVIHVVEELSKALEDLGSTKKQQVMEELFGKHQFARMNALLSNINKGTQALQAKEVTAATPLERALLAQQELNKLGESSLTKFQSAIQELKAAIAPLGKIIMDFVTPAIEGISKIVDGFNKLPDVVKQFSLAIVGIGGVAIPIFVMLLGQFANWVGQGLKVVSMLTGIGKNVKWVNQENLNLANAIGAVDAKLIAENAILIENAALWEARQAAAMGSVGAVGGPVAAPGKGKRKRFAKGGSVGGGDTVPALLTPGEFVVNKKSAKKYGSMLHAMNQGNVPGFASGGVIPRRDDNAIDWSHMSRDMKFDPSKVTGSSAALARFFAAAAQLNVDPTQYLKMVSKFVLPLPHWSNQALKPSHGGLPANSLLPYFSPDTINDKNQPFARTLSGMGLAQLAKSGETVPAQKYYYKEMGKWLEEKKNTTVTDAHIARRSGMIVAMMRGNPKYRDFGTVLGTAMGTAGQVRQVSGSALAKKAVDAGRPDLLKALGLKWEGPQQGARSNKFPMSRFYGRPGMGIASLFAKSFGSGHVPGMSPRGYAQGGFVPGTGNKDTVPAMLAPGEAVINKKASKKFGGILHAMNKGTVGMFAGGYEKEVQGVPLTKGERSALSKVFTDAIDNITIKMAAAFNYGAERAAELKKQIQLDMRAFDAAHVTREVDEQGNKVWRNENLVQTPKGENVKMEALSKSEQNLRVLDQTAKEMGIAMDKRTDLIRRLTNQEHIVEQEQRDLLAAIVQETEARRVAAQNAGKVLPKNQMLSPAFRGESGAAFAGGLGITPLNYATRQAMTKADVDALSAKTNRPGAVPVVIEDDNSPSTKRGMGVGAQSALFMVPMLLGSMTDVTSSMGSLNNAIMIATTGMMLFGNSIPTGGGVKGIFGKGTVAAGKTGIGAKFAKFGLGAGAVGGLAGGLAGSVAGNLIQDQKGGMRDALGQATSWGATGAGLGMMFGPWGAAIGGAAGALAGFTVQMVANNKAQEKMTESILTASERWDKASQSLNEQLGLGTNQTLSKLMAGTNPGTTPEARELYDVFKTEFIDKSGTEMHEMVEDLKTRISSGRAEGPLTDINSFVMSQRALGVEEADIKIMAQAIIASLPEDLRRGLQPETYQVQSSADIIDTINANISRLVAAAPKIGIRETEYTQDASGNLVRAVREISDLNLDGVIQNTTALADTTKYLQTVQLNAALAMTQHAEDTKEYKTALDKYTQAEEDLKAAREAQAGLQQTTMNATPAAQEAFFKAQAQQIGQIEKSGKGMGITGEKWEEYVTNAVANGEKNSQELTDAALMVLQGGIALTDAAGNIRFSADQIKNMGNIRQAQFNAGNVLTAATAEREGIQGGLAQLQEIIDNPIKQPEENKTAAGVSRAEGGVDRAQAALDRAQAKEDARTHKWAKINQGWTIKNASLDISRIHLEERALKGFVKKFNKAFGTSIDSFADAQYQIEKIGLKIRDIQVKTIQPLQEKADDLRRTNELRARRIDELQTKEQERVDAINKSYDEQANILERIKEEQQFIADEAAAAAELTGAFATGNITDITKASINLSKTVSAYGQQQQGRGLEQGREAALANSPYKAEIDRITKQIEATEKSILAIEDQIYNINEKQIEPMQRRSDLMSLMLDTTKSTLEYQKANIKGIDQENLARKEALKTAREAKDNAKHMFDLMNEQKAVAQAQKKLAKEQKAVEEQKNVVVDERIKKLQQEYGLEGLSLEQMKAKLKQLEKDATARETRAKSAVDYLNGAMEGAMNNSNSAVDAWGRPIPAGSTVATLSDLMVWAETGKMPKVNRPKYKESQPGGSGGPAGGGQRGDYAGGPIPGDGGQDSVSSMLTPGEFVMRKSAVKKIGVENLRRMNQDPANAKKIHKDFYAGGIVKLATGGAVPEAQFGGVETEVLNKLLKEPLVKAAQGRYDGETSGGGGASGYIPSGPIPGLAASEPGPSGYPAERAGWIKRSAVRMMRYVKHAFPTQFTGTTYGGSGEHGSGKAVDYMLRKPYRSRAGNADGWGLARWAKKWKGPLGVRGVIFDDKITGYGSWDGWRNYSHFSGSRSDTDRHRDHAHIINYKNGGLVPGKGNIDNMPSMLTPGEFVLNRNAVNRVGTLPLKKLNATSQYSARSQESEPPAIVYNNDYELIFNVNEAIDSREMARVVMKEIKRTTDSQVYVRR